MTSRAASEVTRPMPIFQLKPSGAMTGSTVRPIVPAKLSAICGGRAVLQRDVREDPERDGHRRG